jgi:3-hydroxyacyl-CoA dehydrogenase
MNRPIGVIGAGLIGATVAVLGEAAGLEVTIYDNDYDKRERRSRAVNNMATQLWNSRRLGTLNKLSFAGN